MPGRWKGDYATGDWLGVRTTLERSGVEICGLRQRFGGTRRGASSKGRFTQVCLILVRRWGWRSWCGWKGASVSTTWLWLSGRMPRRISAEFSHHFEHRRVQYPADAGAWFQQDFFQRGGDGAPGLSIRLGRMTAASELVISDYGALFTNGSFGWPAFVSATFPKAVRAILWDSLASAWH